MVVFVWQMRLKVKWKTDDLSYPYKYNCIMSIYQVCECFEAIVEKFDFTFTTLFDEPELITSHDILMIDYVYREIVSELLDE